jgi:hypothetical protein
MWADVRTYFAAACSILLIKQEVAHPGAVIRLGWSLSKQQVVASWQSHQLCAPPSQRRSRR